MKSFVRLVSPAALALCALFASIPAHASEVVYTTWNFPAGINSATGTITGSGLGTINVTYSGQTNGVNFIDGSYGWSPASSYIGGNAYTAPGLYQLGVLLQGGTNMVESITFSKPVFDPTIAIFSLGANGNAASFVFDNPFSIIAGGPSIHYGGSSITSAGDTVYGMEGNGVIQFDGTYSSIDFTTPVAENYYAFTVGASTPEPGTLSLLGLGLGALPVIRRKLSRKR